MVSLASLLLPILLSAVAVFIVSSIIHMVLGYHRNDIRALPDEAAVMSALRPFNLAPGDYGAPLAGSMSAMKEPAFAEKLKVGPVFFMTVRPSGETQMGKALGLWFGYSVVVSLFAAYLVSRTLAPGSEYLAVFRLVGTVAFAGYALGLLQNSIWYGRNWTATLKSVFDGLLYSLVTAGVFGWLWPAA
jgi:hypothetical protein